LAANLDAAARGLSARKYVEAVLLKALRSEGLAERMLTMQERQRGLDALGRLEELDRELLRQRCGLPFSDSGQLLNEVRDQRTRELMNKT
jgi:hypothetical protein